MGLHDGRARWSSSKILVGMGEQGKPPLPTDIPLNCPFCGAKLTNVPSDTSVAFYECPKDGLLVLPSDEKLRRAEG